MAYAWRAELKEKIEDYYVQGPKEWFDMVISAAGKVNITIVSDRFTGISFPERREQIRNQFHQLGVPLSEGFLSLYSVAEAASLELTQPSTAKSKSVYTWFDLAQEVANIAEYPKTLQRTSRIPHTVTFYSFKGGVGRTTALVHAATILAMRGRKVVAVDLDLEAPGLGSALNLTQQPQYGIADYFYERSYMPQDVEPTISIADIFSEIRISNASGRLFVVPAGSLNLGYLAMVDDLRSVAITERGEDLWSTFYREITEQLQPDILLVDSRTGINEWGAFSLLRAADKAIIFLYPNEQNRRGVDVLLEAISSKIPTSFVFSPVPFLNEGGMDMVREHWNALQGGSTAANGNKAASIKIADPIVIPYITGIATSSSYPVQEFLPYYMPIANVIEEETNSIRLRTILADAEYRRELLESLTFPELDATKDANPYALFQRTADFDKFLDPTTCLIRGRKGTGKSTLYWLWLKHIGAALDISFGKPNNAVFLSGHGAFQPCLTADDFQRIDQAIMRDGGSWEALWRIYLLLRLYLNNDLEQTLSKDTFHLLRTFLSRVPKRVDSWRPEHTNALINMVTTTAYEAATKDILRDIDEWQQGKDQAFWLLYDNLDDDLKGEIREKALTGLFQFVQAPYVRRLKAIRCKIFLREDIWSPLTFDNKKYFNGRDLLLQWTYTDFLRLALCQSFASEKFKEAVNNFSPIENLDRANENVLNEALQLLWGGQWESKLDFSEVSEWLWYRLKDASDTIFPQSVSILLREATKLELQTYKDQPPPEDHLLSLKSLHQGLIVASYQRCNEMRKTYPELQPLFDFFRGKDRFITLEDLQRIWEEELQLTLPGLKDFKQFGNYLQGIGLLTGLFNPGEEDTFYAIPPFYAYGFEMSRDADIEP